MKLPCLSLTTLCAFTAVTASAILPLPGPFQPGEILVPNFADSVMRRYSATGSLLQAYSDPGETLWIGSGLTPGGDYVTTFRNPSAGVKVFDDSGLQLQSWTGPAVSVNDVSVFADGTLALTLQNGSIERRTPAGALLGTTPTGASILNGSTVGADNILYFIIPNSALLGRMDAAGTLLGNTNIGFAGGDVVQSPLDGTLWVSNEPAGTIHHFTTAGAPIGSALPSGLAGGGFYGLGIAPDGQSLYATSNVSSTMRHLDLTGASLGDIPLTGNQFGNYFFTVVPVPEPATAGLLALGALGLLGRRRR